jgi:exosortase J
MNAPGSSHPTPSDTELSPPLLSTTPENGLGFNGAKPAGGNVLFFSSLALFVAFASVCLAPVLIDLWNIWTNDPLRSIGMLIVPVGILLTLRVWRQQGWELRGTWWGLLPIVMAFVLSAFRQNLAWYWVAGRLGVNFLPPSLSLYVYASGVVLLFAGTRVWWKAGFPLALLLLAQPVPNLASRLVDMPLQTLSAHIARSFASLIGFPPTSPQLLKLMFTPDFGMFIAPGCDGLRGAVTLGYVALIVGYLKRVSIRRWFSYACGAVLLGYLFNLIRLCALVLYYRIAVGRPALENVAKQADYLIGACLFVAATLLFLWVVSRKEDSKIQIDSLSTPPHQAAGTKRQQSKYWKLAAFAGMTLLFVVPAAHAIRDYRDNLAASGHLGALTAEQLDALMPKQLGDYKLNRAWQQKVGSANAVESAVYTASGSDEIVLGVWLLPIRHTVHDSMTIRGEDPEMRASRSFVTARGQAVSFDTAFYSDGISDTLAGNALCSPSSCSLSHYENGLHMTFIESMDSAMRGMRAVPIYFRIETPHADAPEDSSYKALSAEAQRFLGGVDLAKLSRTFQ